MKRLASLFLTGLATLLPIVLSIYIVFWVFTIIDNILAPFLAKYFGIVVPGLGFLLTIIIVLLVGLISTNLLGKKFVVWGEIIIYRTPLLGKIYSTVRKITNSIFSSGKGSFRTVVLVEFPRKGIYSLGFITNENVPFLDEDNYSIFIPTTPNPTSGWFIIMPKESVKILDMSVDVGIEMVISAGMVNGNS